MLKLEAYDLSTLNRYGVLLSREKIKQCRRIATRKYHVDPTTYTGNYAVFENCVRTMIRPMNYPGIGHRSTHVPTLNNYAVPLSNQMTTPIQEYTESTIDDSEEGKGTETLSVH